jgi:peptidoglycan/xylan/chitin deacetylase (PgdA/CDA1 family)
LEKKIALTFDDGPGPNTKQFLDLLDRYNVKATFFMLSEQVKIRPEMAKRVSERGHEIGNHTTQHKNYKARLKEIKKTSPENAVELAKKELVEDMNSSRDVIEKAIDHNMKLLRMPHGIDGPWIHEAAKESGFVLVNWTYGADWTSATAQELIPPYVKAIKPGAIILLHDGWPKSQKSLDITKAVIEAAKDQGFEIVTVGELLGMKN